MGLRGSVVASERLGPLPRMLASNSERNPPRKSRYPPAGFSVAGHSAGGQIAGFGFVVKIGRYDRIRKIAGLRRARAGSMDAGNLADCRYRSRGDDLLAGLRPNGTQKTRPRCSLAGQRQSTSTRRQRPDDNSEKPASPLPAFSLLRPLNGRQLGDKAFGWNLPLAGSPLVQLGIGVEPHLITPSDEGRLPQLGQRRWTCLNTVRRHTTTDDRWKGRPLISPFFHLSY